MSTAASMPWPETSPGDTGPGNDTQRAATPMRVAPLDGVRIIDCSLLGPGSLAMHLADLGADVIKVEPPGGDPLRRTTWPMVDGVSLMHLHVNRNKRSVGIDLRTHDGADVFRDLVRTADAVIEGMRPGALARRGLGYHDLEAVNPRLVFCSISGFGSTGPYRDVPSHGVAFDAWAGVVAPEVDDAGACAIPEHPSIGIHAGPLFGALGVTAAILRARTTGEGSYLEVAQSVAAASMDWLRSETWMSYRHRDRAGIVDGSGDERRAPGTAGMRHGVRYQFYATKDDRHILFMASERVFWHNFCRGIGRLDLFEAWPGEERGDHATGNTELRDELIRIFAARTAADWVDFAARHDTAIAPVNTPGSLPDDPQFRERFSLYRADELGTHQLPSPIRFHDTSPTTPTKAPTTGQHTDDVLQRELGCDAETITRLRGSGAVH